MGRDPHIFSRPARISPPVNTMAREVIAWLIINATITTYLAYRNLSRVKPLSDDDRSYYDDL